MMWARVQCFRHEYPLLSSILIFFGIVLGGLFFVIWPPLARGYLVALPVLFAAYELRKRVLVDRSSLVWIPSLVALVFILLWPIPSDTRAILLCTWMIGSVGLLKLRRRARP